MADSETDIDPSEDDETVSSYDKALKTLVSS